MSYDGETGQTKKEWRVGVALIVKLLTKYNIYLLIIFAHLNIFVFK